jgi:hypothetical protein
MVQHIFPFIITIKDFQVNLQRKRRKRKKRGKSASPTPSTITDKKKEN